MTSSRWFLISVSSAGLITLRTCNLNGGPLDVMLLDMLKCYRICLSKFFERSLQRPAARHDHRPLNEILEFTNIARPLPSGEALHDDWRNGVNFLLHLLGELLDELTHQLWYVFPSSSDVLCSGLGRFLGLDLG